MKPLMRIAYLCAVLVGVASLSAAERINHEGRILGPAPVVTNATLFNTPAADASCPLCRFFRETMLGTKTSRVGPCSPIPTP